MPQISISVSNQSGATINGNGNVTDPAILTAAQTVIDALNAAAKDTSTGAPLAAKGA